jgi:hypothetical protein
MIRFFEWSTRGQPDRTAAHASYVKQDVHTLERRRQRTKDRQGVVLSPEDRSKYIPAQDHPVQKRARRADNAAAKARHAYKTAQIAKTSIFHNIWHAAATLAPAMGGMIYKTPDNEEEIARKASEKAIKQAQKTRGAYHRHIEDVRGGKINPDGSKAHANEFEKLKRKERIASRRIAKLKKRLAGDPKAIAGMRKALGGGMTASQRRAEIDRRT